MSACDGRTDGQTDRETDMPIVASTGLAATLTPCKNYMCKFARVLALALCVAERGAPADCGAAE